MSIPLSSIPAQYRVFGIIRNDVRGWHVIDYDGHIPSGVMPGTAGCSVVEGGFLKVNFEKAARFAGSAVVQADETYVLRRVQAGVSLGYDHALVRFTGPGGVIIHPSDLNDPAGNFFFEATMFV